MDTSSQCPVQKRDISTINDSWYYESDDQVDKISDSEVQVDVSSKSSTNSTEQVEPKIDLSRDPSSDPRGATRITNWIQKLLINQIPVSFEALVIGQDLVTGVQETSREGLSQESLKPLQTISSK